MDLSEELIKEQNLTEDQVTAISAFGKSHVADKQKEWDGKANTDAQNIIQGAIDKTMTDLGIKDVTRNEGEKAADFFARVSKKYFADKETELANSKKAYDDKVKNFKGDETLRGDFDTMKLSFDALKQKTADYDSLKETADKYEPTLKKLNGLELDISLSSVKPAFPDTVNKYEADAKWNEFISKVQQTHDIKRVDGKAMAVNKENQYDVKPLEDLVKKDETIQELLKGREQKGPGGKTIKEMTKIKDVPFDVPKDATSTERNDLIKKYLIEDLKMNVMSAEYSKKFLELNKKIIQAEKPT